METQVRDLENQIKQINDYVLNGIDKDKLDKLKKLQ